MASENRVRQFTEILIWPLQLIPLHESDAARSHCDRGATSLRPSSRLEENGGVEASPARCSSEPAHGRCERGEEPRPPRASASMREEGGMPLYYFALAICSAQAFCV